MLEEFIQNWWLPVVRGLALFVFGLVALFIANNMSLVFAEVLFRVSLVMLFAVYLAISASLTMVTAALIRHESHRWIYFAHGLLLGGLCLAVLASPTVRLETIVLLTIAHALVNGLGEARVAYQMRNHHKEASLLTVMSVMSIIAAVVLMLRRNHPIASITTVLAVYALAYGLCLAYFGWHLHRQFALTTKMR